MALSHEVLTGNGEAIAQTAKRKTRKPGTSGRDPLNAGAKSAARRASGTAEILFTQAPNPLEPPVPPYIWIDYPAQNAVLSAPSYSVRLGVGGAQQVEISVDKSPWLPCRLTAGYWWYDWSGIPRGKHTIAARMRTPDNRWFKTPPRQCSYRPE